MRPVFTIRSMSLRLKNIVYTAILLIAAYLVYVYRSSSHADPVKIEGPTMGTTYHITYFDDQQRDFKASIDSLLTVFNQSLNTYLPDAEISKFNAGDSALTFALPYFFPVLKRSSEIVSASNGAFDPTVMPLVNAWGFGPGKRLNPDSLQVDSILQFVGFEKIEFNEDSVWKLEPRVQLDFSAIAKGYGVDVVANFLKTKGIRHMLVEIGGEVVTSGRNVKEKKEWTVGVLDPNSTYDNQRFKAIVKLQDKALATSGNYFNYREVEGRKYSHTIDPVTGRPIQRAILSASIIADDCMTADGWATACMVMGHEKAIEILGTQKKIDALLIYSMPDGSLQTYMTPGIQSQITIQP